MFYKRLSNEALKKFYYPNLMAEWRESRYSFCTLGDHMGLGCHREENDPEIWAKLRGEISITAEEAIGLAGLFGVKLNYLFSRELEIFGDMPVAYWRWLESNKRMDEQDRIFHEMERLRQVVEEKPYLLEHFTMFSDMKEEELNLLIDTLKGQNKKAFQKNNDGTENRDFIYNHVSEKSSFVA